MTRKNKQFYNFLSCKLSEIKEKRKWKCLIFKLIFNKRCSFKHLFKLSKGQSDFYSCFFFFSCVIGYKIVGQKLNVFHLFLSFGFWWPFTTVFSNYQITDFKNEVHLSAMLEKYKIKNKAVTLLTIFSVFQLYFFL